MFKTKKGFFVAHRGTQPENTLYAFKKAFAAGFMVAECDVHATKDGEIIICHDATLQRTAVSGPAEVLAAPIKQLSLAECRQVTVGNADHQEPVPLLRELLVQMPMGRRLLVEIKFDDVAMLKPFVEAIHHDLSRVVVISFEFDVLVALKKSCPACTVIFLTVSGDDGGCYTVVNDLPSCLAVCETVQAAGFEGLGVEFSDWVTKANLAQLPGDVLTQVWSATTVQEQVVAELQACCDSGVCFINVDSEDVFF